MRRLDIDHDRLARVIREGESFLTEHPALGVWCAAVGMVNGLEVQVRLARQRGPSQLGVNKADDSIRDRPLVCPRWRSLIMRFFLLLISLGLLAGCGRAEPAAPSITPCSRCGSTDLRMIGTPEGVVPYCERCGTPREPKDGR